MRLWAKISSSFPNSLPISRGVIPQLLENEISGEAHFFRRGFFCSKSETEGVAFAPSVAGIKGDDLMSEIFLIVGLALFLGAHLIPVLTPKWRQARITKLGELRWKGLFSLISLLGFTLLVWGYGVARVEPVVLWLPPVWTRHVAALLMVPAFVLLVAAYVPGNWFKTKLGHPMVLGTKTWALAHLLANGNLADVLLFGSFLLWAIIDFANARRRDRIAGKTYAAGPITRTIVVVIVGVVASYAFMRYLHLPLIGMSPMAPATVGGAT